MSKNRKVETKEVSKTAIVEEKVETKEVSKFPMSFTNKNNPELLFWLSQRFSNWITIVNNEEELWFLKNTMDYKDWFISLTK